MRQPSSMDSLAVPPGTVLDNISSTALAFSSSISGLAAGADSVVSFVESGEKMGFSIVCMQKPQERKSHILLPAGSEWRR